MIPRWNLVVDDIKAFCKALDKLVKYNFRRSKRGRKPKHSIRSYFKLIIAKEAKKASLRAAETDYSKAVCDRRVDHSVIHYWEKKFDKSLVERIVKAIGSKLEKLLGYLFSVIDSTEFTLWNKSNIEFHLLNRIAGTVYPVGIHFGKASPSMAVSNCLTDGSKHLYADAWYDDNKSFRIMIRKGYQPIVKSNKDRWRGYWRHRARKMWNKLSNRFAYRNRGRGESVFGTLTNWLGDRLKTSLISTSITRIGARILAYLVRIYMRISVLYGILRHAQKIVKDKYSF